MKKATFVFKNAYREDEETFEVSIGSFRCISCEDEDGAVSFAS